MPVYENYKAIHIHIPKCAGTFIERKLGLPYSEGEGMDNLGWDSLRENYLYGPIEGDGNKNGYYQHASFDQIGAEYSWAIEEGICNYFVFAFVRNPYDRLVSEYHYLKRKGDPYLGLMSFKDFCFNLDSKWPMYIEDHLAPQNCFFGSGDVDFVGRMESFDKGWKFVSNRLGLKSVGILNDPKVNSSGGRDHAACMNEYDNESRRVVADFYEEDFERFKYNKEKL